MGSKQPSQVTQVNRTELSPEAQKIANLAFPMAQEYANTSINLPTETIAGFNANDIGAQNAALGAIPTGTQIGSDAASSLGFLLNPNILSPDTNPYLKASGQAVTDQFTDNLLQRVLPGLRGGFSTATGPYAGGASKEGIAQGLAVGESSEALAGQLSNMYSTAYQNGLGTMLQAGQLVPSIQAAQLFGPQVQAMVGEAQRSMSQAQLDAQNQYAMLQQQLPLLQAQQLFGLINGIPGAQTGSSTVTGAQPQGSKVGSALGGAASGAAMGSTFGPIGTGVGALLGGLGGFFL